MIHTLLDNLQRAQALLRKQKNKQTTLLSLLIAMVILTAASPALAILPSNAYTSWNLPEAGYTDMDWTVDPQVDPSPQSYFMAHQWWIQNSAGDKAGYAGLQTMGGPNNNQKIAIFSIWEAQGATTTNPNAYCQTFGGEGIGYSCRLPFEWEIGQTYKFNLRRVSTTDWEASVTYGAAANKQIIGTITAKAGSTALAQQTINFTEYYGPWQEECSDYNYIRVKYGRPYFNNKTVRPLANSYTHKWTRECGTDTVSNMAQEYSYHETGIKYGLTGTYYNDTNLLVPSFFRDSLYIGYTWNAGSPMAGMPADNFSAKWTSKFKAKETGPHTFCTKYDDGARLWVNGVQLVNNWGPHPLTESCGTVQLTIGNFYDIRLEYMEATGDARVNLTYSTVSVPKSAFHTRCSAHSNNDKI